MIDRNIIHMYSRPQQGGDLTFFRGKQYGGNWKSVFGRYALPILKQFGIPIAKLAGKALWNAGRNVIENKTSVKDALLGSAKEVLPEIKRHARNAIHESTNFLGGDYNHDDDYDGNAKQRGSGLLKANDFIQRRRRQRGRKRINRKNSINKYGKRLKTIFS